MKLYLPIITTLLYSATALERCDHGNECTDPDVIRLNTTTCSTYHIFTARGSNAKKPGHAGELIRQICTELGDCNFEDIDFPARGGGNGWCESAHKGAVNGVAQLRNYTEKCPDSNLIVVGFSQGAGVSLDYLGGGGDVHVFGCNQSSNTGLDRSTAPGSKIVAALVFGSTVRRAGTTYTLGGGRAFNGTAPRPQRFQNNLQTYADAGLLREYCNEGDPICAIGSEPSSMNNHLSYFEKYTTEAVNWTIATAREQVRKNEEEKNRTEQEKNSTNGQGQAGTGTSGASRPSNVVLEGARGTWGLCGFVVVGTLFFLSL